MTRTVLARIIHGSRLFGLSTPSSDWDYISVVLPSREDVLTGSVDFITAEGSSNDNSRRNNKDDVDDKQISLMRFLNQIASGRLEEIELLNAPLSFHTRDPHPLFLHLRDNRARLASSNIDKIVGFCLSQAVTYSTRNDRYVAAKAAYEAMLAAGATADSKTRSGAYFPAVMDAAGGEHVRIVDIPLESGKVVPHLEVCGKRVAETAHAGLGLEILSALVARYGERIRDVASMKSHDWKALSHALRIAREGMEYVNTGMITLPLPGADYIRAVKLGEFPLDAVAAEVEDTVNALKAASRSSPLPREADLEFIRETILEAHHRTVVDGAPAPLSIVP